MIKIKIIFCILSVLVLTFPQISQSDPQIKLHQKITFAGSAPYLASSLYIIDNEKQYKEFISDTWDIEYQQIDFTKQILIILSAPSNEPQINDIRFEKNLFIIDVEYSEALSGFNGFFTGTAILIDRPDFKIKISEESLKQHEQLYGKNSQCYRNSLNNTVDKKVLEASKASISNIFNDIYKLKKRFRELKDFNEDNVGKDNAPNKIPGIGYRSDSPEKGFLLHVYIEHPLEPPIKPNKYGPGPFGPSFSYIFIKKYPNICTNVKARLYSDNKRLKKKVTKIIKKYVAPLEKLNEEAK